MSNKTCIMCDMFWIEDSVHIINQCPFYQMDCVQMYKDIYRKCPNAGRIFEENRVNTLYYLLGKKIPSVEENEIVFLPL